MAFFSEPITAVTERIRSGKIRCTEIVNQALDAIIASDERINAFITIQPDIARCKASRLDDLPQHEKECRPLLGIPIAVKDNMCTATFPTTCASKILSNFLPPYNATVVDALEKAGAVIVGKTNLDEFAMGSSTENSAIGITRNPHNTQYIPGGSSGGSAAAVAADFVPCALGSDTGGSIRQPSSHCGVVGLKPTYGRVSRYGLIAFASALDQIGPITQKVQDCGLVLSVLAGHDQRDSTCAGKPFTHDPALYGESLKGMTVGIPREYFGEGLTEPVARAMDRVLEVVKDAGAKTVEVSLPNVKYAIATYYIICTAEASSNLARFDGVKYGTRVENPASLMDMYKRTRREGFGAEVKRRIMLGTYVLSSGYYDAYYLKAARVRTLIRQDFERVFTKCDTVISPVATTPAFKLGEKCDDPLQMYLTDIYTVSANLAGIPGISVPCARHCGLPIGVQFMAPQWREDTLLKIGYVTQEQTRSGTV